MESYGDEKGVMLVVVPCSRREVTSSIHAVTAPGAPGTAPGAPVTVPGAPDASFLVKKPSILFALFLARNCFLYLRSALMLTPKTLILIYKTLARVNWKKEVEK